MDAFSIIGFTFALPALAFAIRNHERLNNLENKLKAFDVIPKGFDSEKPEQGAALDD